MKVVLDKERELKFTFKALLEIEKELGKKLSEFSAENVGLNEIFILFYHGLKATDPKLTKDMVLDIIDKSGIDVKTIAEYVGQALAEAFGASFRTAE